MYILAQWDNSTLSVVAAIHINPLQKRKNIEMFEREEEMKKLYFLIFHNFSTALTRITANFVS